MKNPVWAFKEWRRRELARIDALRGGQLFWVYLTIGLTWALFVFALVTFWEYLTDGAAVLDGGRLQRHAALYFAGGILFGLLMWTDRPSRKGGRRDVH